MNLSPLRKLQILLLALTSFVGARADFDSDADERKADWMFMEALSARSQDNNDAHFALVTRALQLTPDKTGREAYEVASARLILSQYEEDSLAFNRAIRLLDDYFAAHPSDVYAGAFLARAYAQQQEPDKALQIYDILETHRPNSPNLMSAHADMLLNAKRYDDAIDIYRRLEKVMGRSTPLAQRISNIYLWKEDTIGALAEVHDYLKDFPKSVDALQLAAAAELSIGTPQRALELINRALELDPTNGSSYYYAANIYHDTGDADAYGRAVIGAVTGSEVDLDNKIELTRYFISNSTDSIRDTPIAETLLKSLVNQYPRESEVLHLAMAYEITHRRWAQAADIAESIVAAEPENPDTYQPLARLYFTAGKESEAIDALRRGISAFPDYPDNYKLLSGILADNNPAEALKTLDKALEIDSLPNTERSELLCTYADIAQKAPQLGISPDSYYEKSLEANPDNDLAMNNYAYYLVDTKENGDLLRAKELIARAVIYQPGASTYYDTYACVLLRLGDLQGAKRYIDMAITSASPYEAELPSFAEVMTHAAEIYQALGQTDKANEYRRRADELTKQESSENQE